MTALPTLSPRLLENPRPQHEASKTMDSKAQSPQQNQGDAMPRSLTILKAKSHHNFIKPVKKINEGLDVPHFLTSQAYGDLGIFVMQLNLAMCPRKSSVSGQVHTWQLDSPIILQEPVRKLQELLQNVDAIIEEVPPDTGPRRFGNVSFRRWYEILESRAQDLLKTHVPKVVLHFGGNSEGEIASLDELIPYFLGAFGSAQRLDYGTGHELSFLAFLGCIWKLGGFTTEHSQSGSLERSIVIAVIEPYLRVIRRLIITYTLEPAGSHGVWGLDDHFFLPYIFGSAQYCPAITDEEAMPVEGSLPDSPNPGDVVESNIVERERKRSMYFAAVGFIDDVKSGPFWEHSPILFDISGLRSGWGKINKGMIKMYNAEVLSKFPVVQHFPFGSLFSWEQDPNAISATRSVHSSNQPPGRLTTSSAPTAPTSQPTSQGGTKAPVPWMQTPAGPPQGMMPSTRAPWASSRGPGAGSKSPMPVGSTTTVPSPHGSGDGPTRAPWAADQNNFGRR